jgi:hypothetical protein
MSSYQAIEAVSSAIQTIISERIDVPVHSHAASRSDVDVTIGLPPKDDEVGDGDPRINLFLYRVTENPFLKNQQIPGHGDPNGYGHPPLSLNLHYLVTAYGLTVAAGADLPHDDRTAQQLLGSAMRILHDAPIITPALVSDPVLDGAYEKAKVTLEPLSIEDVSKVWTALNRPYRLSVAYEASLVQIESTEPDRFPRRVGEPPAGPHTTVIPAVGATIEEMRSSVRPGPYACAGEEVAAIGRNLALADMAATVGGVAATVSSSREDRLTLIVPGDAALTPGVVPVRVTARADLGSPPTPRTIVASNIAALVVMPHVDTATEAGGVVSIEGTKLYAAGAECMTLVGDAIVASASYASGSTPQRIEFPRPAGLAAGTYPVRVRVNGAEDLDGKSVTLP